MKATELIKKLQEIVDKEGDLECVTWTDDNSYPVTVITVGYGNFHREISIS